MPNVNRIISPYLGGTGNPDTAVEQVSTTPGANSPYAPGDLGTTFDFNDKTYTKVTLDSGATAATPTGVVAANQLAYWKDRSKYIVTNDVRQAYFSDTLLSNRNNVAGLFRAAVPAGYSCFILQRGRSVNVKEVGSATAGMQLVASTSTTAADALGVAINTAAPCMPIGVVITATANNVCVADFDIPNIP